MLLTVAMCCWQPTTGQSYGVGPLYVRYAAYLSKTIGQTLAMQAAQPLGFRGVTNPGCCCRPSAQAFMLLTSPPLSVN